MASGDSNDEEDVPPEQDMPVQSDVESSTDAGDGSDKDDTPPDEDLSHWGDYDPVARPLLEELGYRNTETSGNLIYNWIVGEFAGIGHPDRMKDARVAALNLRIMFKRWAKFGELDFDP